MVWEGTWQQMQIMALLLGQILIRAGVLTWGTAVGHSLPAVAQLLWPVSSGDSSSLLRTLSYLRQASKWLNTCNNSQYCFYINTHNPVVRCYTSEFSSPCVRAPLSRSSASASFKGKSTVVDKDIHFLKIANWLWFHFQVYLPCILD